MRNLFAVSAQVPAERVEDFHKQELTEEAPDNMTPVVHAMEPRLQVLQERATDMVEDWHRLAFESTTEGHCSSSIQKWTERPTAVGTGFLTVQGTRSQVNQPPKPGHFQ